MVVAATLNAQVPKDVQDLGAVRKQVSKKCRLQVDPYGMLLV